LCGYVSQVIFVNLHDSRTALREMFGRDAVVEQESKLFDDMVIVAPLSRITKTRTP